MSDFEDYPGPFHMPMLDKGNLFHTRDIAGVIAGPCEDTAKVGVEVRGLIARGYIIPVGKDRNDARGSLLFSADALFVSAALRAATDLGLAGKDKLARIANALQVWQQEPQDGMPRTPAMFILRALLDDPRPHGFSAELHVSRQVDTGQLALRAAIRHGEHGHIGTDVVTVPDHHMPVAAAIIPLDDLAAQIVANLQKRKAN